MIATWLAIGHVIALKKFLLFECAGAYCDLHGSLGQVGLLDGSQCFPCPTRSLLLALCPAPCPQF